MWHSGSGLTQIDPLRGTAAALVSYALGRLQLRADVAQW